MSDEIFQMLRMVRIVKDVEEIDPPRPIKIMKLREKRVRLAEHVIAEGPIQRWGHLKNVHHMCVLFFFCSDAKCTDMADD